MQDWEWGRGPFGPGAGKGATVQVRRRVLAVVHHMTAANRLADVLPLVERDHRVQVVCTVAPASTLSAGAVRHLLGSGAVVIPWAQAAHTPFDLAIAAGDGALEQLHAPVMVLQHGAGPNTLIHRWAGRGKAARRPVAGLRPEAIVAGGRVIPSVLAVCREAHRDLLLSVCPEAEEAVVVAGDPAFDRIRASAHLREEYRAALDVEPGGKLLVVSSTWGPRSLLGKHPGLPARLAAELPGHRVVLVPHPNTWAWHGRRQVLAWLAEGRRRGLRVVGPETGWGAALVAADQLLGDHGSVMCYGAALGTPVALAAFPDGDAVPGSPVDLLGRTAPRLDLAAPVAPQLGEAARVRPPARRMRTRITSRPGRAAPILRGLMYGLLGLAEPAWEARAEELSPAQPLEPLR